MSARMPTILDAPGDEVLDVHEWLERVNDGADISQLEPSPLATVCTSAVDPLEIAVALEVAGISHAVATDRYNRADVFALARTLWNRTPFRPAQAKPVDLPRPGDRRDLGRGVLYALPALMLLGITVAFGLELAAWVLPFAISWGWGLGQVAAFVGYRMQGAEPAHEAALMTRVAVGATSATLVVATVAAIIGGGGVVGVSAATALVTYIITSAILLVRAEERWLALLLVPGTVAAVVVLVVSKESLVSQILAVALIGASFVGVIVRALRHMTFSVSGTTSRFGKRDTLAGFGHLLHGLICGLAVSLVVIRIGHPSPDEELGRMLLPIPLLATLGVMEWQLHTFRHRIVRLTHTLEDVREFPGQAWYVFCRSLLICTAAIVSAATAVVLIVQIDGGDAPVKVLAVQCALGALFFSDLILMLLDRLDLVLGGWLAGVAAGGIAAIAGFVLTDSETGMTLFTAAGVLVAVVLISLLISARKVVSAAMNH